MFPYNAASGGGPCMQDIRSAAKLLSEARHSRYQEQQTAGGGWRYVLVVVDGTWRQAKEMYKASPLTHVDNVVLLKYIIWRGCNCTDANAPKLLFVQELRTWLPASVKAVHLPLVTAVDGPAAQDYLIRSQPDAICMSTMEAAARLGSSCPNSNPDLVISV